MKRISNIILIMLILLSYSACKKQKIEPKKPDPIVPTPCVYDTTGIWVGQYFSIGTSYKDTITIVFVKDNCPEESRTYKIKNLSQAFANWAVGIEDKDYVVTLDNACNQYDNTDTIKINNPSGFDLEISAKSGDKFTPYLKFKRIL